MTHPTVTPYMLALYRKAEQARSRKEAIALIHEAERIRNSTRPIHELIRDSHC
jgi:hypothetical protein